MQPHVSELQLSSADGYALAATRYHAPGPVRGRIVVGGATGVPQGFYRRFALYAAAQGYEVMTLDYRGIGKSRPARLRGFRMNYLDWARQDLAAAVDAMHSPELPLYLVGHSYGGHALGLLPNHHKLSAACLFATGAGWAGWMPFFERWRVRLMWSVVAPLLVRSKGYLAWSWLGMGEDLPLDVYRQWKHWCGFPRYFFDDPDMHTVTARFAEVQSPILACNATDDLWAVPRSRDAFVAGYRNSRLHTWDIDPRQAGMGPVGHMGYFRAACQPLWERSLHWLEQQRPAAV